MKFVNLCCRCFPIAKQSENKVCGSTSLLFSTAREGENEVCGSVLQYNFVRSGGVQLALNMLTKNNFLSNADLPTRR